MTLREVCAPVLEFKVMAENGDLIDEQALRDTFEGLMFPVEMKLDSYVEVANSILRDADAFEEEAKRCMAKAQSLRNNAQRMKDTAAYFVDLLPDRKVKTQFHSFGYKANGGKVPMEIDEDKVPKKYLIMQPKVDTAAIRELLDSGKAVKWARYKERGEHFEWR